MLSRAAYLSPPIIFQYHPKMRMGIYLKSIKNNILNSSTWRFQPKTIHIPWSCGDNGIETGDFTAFCLSLSGYSDGIYIYIYMYIYI
jgi:hypothetical protein